MRFICAAAIIGMLGGPAFGQVGGQSKTTGPPPPPLKTQQEINASQAAEKAYQNSVRNIPDKDPVDPWGNVRSDTAPTPSAKSKQRAKATVN